VTWPSSRTEFLVYKSFYNETAASGWGSRSSYRSNRCAGLFPSTRDRRGVHQVPISCRSFRTIPIFVNFSSNHFQIYVAIFSKCHAPVLSVSEFLSFSPKIQFPIYFDIVYICMFIQVKSANFMLFHILSLIFWPFSHILTNGFGLSTFFHNYKLFFFEFQVCKLPWQFLSCFSQFQVTFFHLILAFMSAFFTNHYYRVHFSWHHFILVRFFPVFLFKFLWRFFFQLFCNFRKFFYQFLFVWFFMIIFLFFNLSCPSHASHCHFGRPICAHFMLS